MTSGKNVIRTRVLSVVVAIVIVAAGIFMFAYAFRTHNTGVPLHIVAYATGDELSGGYLQTGLQGVSVTLMSTVPNALKSQFPYAVNLSDLNATNKSYEVMLYHGITGSAGTLSLNLPVTFNNIVYEWRNMTHRGSMVSISLYAEYGYISNGELYSYYYYDNIPYNPFVSIANMHFNVAFSINISHPNTVVALNELTSISMSGPNLPCNPGY
jgi:hypothetical protein